ncbi:carbohydrate kinase family protein [Treponema sp.]|uniref:carbohydrate kinase family protein n=1 Tax=Treponema sp. TaxID=166 RepID=UPI0025D2D2C7|nr:carbohydrate kinase family protein [Treponema sp.]MCR5217371.1 carbohydrate kinase family protein [Treponema sp.]
MENHHKILCIGNVSVDIKAFSMLDDDTEAYRDGTIELVPGGVGRGMAINLKHLGFDTSIYSVVGNDIFGDYLKAGLEAEKINTELLRVSSQHETALFSVMSKPNSHSSCIYSTKVLSEIVFDEQVKAFIEKENIKTLVLDSNISEETFAEIYAYKKDHPDLFIFQNATAPDIARRSLKYAGLVNLFACNEYEAQAIIGETATPDLETADKMQALGYRDFIITFEDRGVMVRINGETYNAPPYTPYTIVDTIGAGDALASGFLTGYLTGESLKQCVHYGLICAKETLMTRQTVSSLLSRDYLATYKNN